MLNTVERQLKLSIASKMLKKKEESDLFLFWSDQLYGTITHFKQPSTICYEHFLFSYQ